MKSNVDSCQTQHSSDVKQKRRPIFFVSFESEKYLIQTTHMKNLPSLILNLFFIVLKIVALRKIQTVLILVITI